MAGGQGAGGGGGGGGGGGSGAPKVDELQPHPAKEQFLGISFCITSPPPWHEAIMLGFQHYIVMLGTTVLIPSILVPQMGGNNADKAKVIQTLLFVSGINTLLQTELGTRLPVVIGGSYAFILPILSIIGKNQGNLDPHDRFRHTIQGTQAALIIASALQIILGFSGLWAIVARFLSPLSSAPVVVLVGLGLYELGFPGVGKCIEIGLPLLIILVFFSQFAREVIPVRKAIFSRFAILVSVAIIWAYAYILTVSGAYRHRPLKTQMHCRTDRSGLVSHASWISVPYPFQFGAPQFDAGQAFAMMAAAFVSLVESTGTFLVAARWAGATPTPPSVLSRGIGWQGVGILLNGMFGTVTGSTVSVENAGLLGLTCVGSRRVIQISAGFMIFFSILGKFGAVFASIPAPIIASIYCLLFAYVAGGGLSFLQFCNLNSVRTKFILGFSLYLGLSVPQYFNEFTISSGHGPVHTDGRWFNDIINVIFASPAVVAGIVALTLDSTLQIKEGPTRKDRGWHWWEKFRSFKTDPRSEEFYALPLNLNKFFPSV